MQRIYEPASLMEAEMLVGMLASEGIEVHVVGRDLVGAMGDLPMQGLLALAVTDEQAGYARQLIDEYNAAQPLAGDEPESFPGTLIC
ncbi:MULTISPECIES: putative signal transducing protein [unclassified Pseudomonas]|uniref:putative signal transducing protein n=1 Tax=unclassified Pseudomonas TaxID=196821 RepID=UPI0035C03BC7